MAKAKVEMRVEGMTCQGCVRTVEKKLSGIDGVDYAHVNLGASNATVEFDDSKTKAEKLIAAVEQVGYRAIQV
jgi:copper ion binding protein